MTRTLEINVLQLVKIEFDEKKKKKMKIMNKTWKTFPSRTKNPFILVGKSHIFVFLMYSKNILGFRKSLRILFGQNKTEIDSNAFETNKLGK